MTTRIVLIRHGETPWNAEKRLQGHIDIPLNEAGQRQARALGRALRGEHFDAIYASDLQRARQTAEALVAARALGTVPAVCTDAALRERCYGGFEGLLISEIAVRYPEAYAAWKGREVDAPLPPGERAGESFRAFYERSVAALTRLGARHPGQSLAVVAHGGVLECAYRAALGMPLATPRSFPIHNASINRFTLDEGRLALEHWGDVDHLAVAMDELG
jgi:probable phosphoglycerate mutase